MDDFQLTKTVVNFNCSYGTVPKVVREYQNNLSAQCESNPYLWFTKTYREKLESVRIKLAKFLSCRKEDFVFVDNTSSGANSVFNSIDFRSNSAVVITDIAYGLIVNLAKKMHRLFGSTVHVVEVNVLNLNTLPDKITEAIDYLVQEGYNVELVCCEHIASCPGILLPVEKVAQACSSRNIPLMVDAAHAIGQININLEELGACGVTYWITDCHKWFFSPKGSAIMWVHKNKQNNVHPVIDCATIGTKGCITEKSRSRLTEFEYRFLYLGTKDYTPWLSINKALEFVDSMGGYSYIIDRNRQLAIEAQQSVCEAIQTNTSFTNESTASIANIPLPAVISNKFIASYLMDTLRDVYNTYVVIYEYPFNSSKYFLRLCLQLFITDEEVDFLTITIKDLLSSIPDK